MSQCELLNQPLFQLEQDILNADYHDTDNLIKLLLHLFDLTGRNRTKVKSNSKILKVFFLNGYRPGEFDLNQKQLDLLGKYGPLSKHPFAEFAIGVCLSELEENNSLGINSLYELEWYQAAFIPKSEDRLAILQKSVDKLREMKDTQCSDGNWNYSPYMHGMANGMIFALSVFDDKQPEFLEAPAKWLRATPDSDHTLTIDLKSQVSIWAEEGFIPLFNAIKEVMWFVDDWAIIGITDKPIGDMKEINNEFFPYKYTDVIDDQDECSSGNIYFPIQNSKQFIKLTYTEVES